MLVTLQKEVININHPKNIIFEIKTLDNMLTRKIITYTKKAGISFPLSPVQLKILHYLLLHQDELVYQRDIEKFIDSRRSTTSEILNTMEKNQLIKRMNSPIDARTKQIILTEMSHQVSQYMLEQKKDFEKKLINLISNEDLETFFKVTELLKTNIMNMNE